MPACDISSTASRNFRRTILFLLIAVLSNPCRAFFATYQMIERKGYSHQRNGLSQHSARGCQGYFSLRKYRERTRTRSAQLIGHRCTEDFVGTSIDATISANGVGHGGGGGINRPRRRDWEGNDSDDDGSEKELSELLKKLGLTRADIDQRWGDRARSLSSEKLLRFLKSYANMFNRKMIDTWPAWRDKMLADPDFVYKLIIEQTVGLGLVMSGTIAARGKDILKELDFFLTDCTVGMVLNFVLTWLLAPSVGARTGSTPLMAKLAMLPANVFAEGSFTLKQRVAAGFYKGALFGVCGFLGSVGGTSLAYMLFLIRRITNPSSAKDGKQLPNVVANSLGWASFMFVSTNPRYQLVNGLEQVIYKVAPGRLGRAGSLVVRTVNNLAGGVTWVMWARLIGLQGKAPDPLPEQASALAGGGAVAGAPGTGGAGGDTTAGVAQAAGSAAAGSNPMAAAAVGDGKGGDRGATTAPAVDAKTTSGAPAAASRGAKGGSGA